MGSTIPMKTTFVTLCLNDSSMANTCNAQNINPQRNRKEHEFSLFTIMFHYKAMTSAGCWEIRRTCSTISCPLRFLANPPFPVEMQRGSTKLWHAKLHRQLRLRLSSPWPYMLQKLGCDIPQNNMCAKEVKSLPISLQSPSQNFFVGLIFPLQLARRTR